LKTQHDYLIEQQSSKKSATVALKGEIQKER